MMHKAINLTFKEGTIIELTFMSGEIKSYDMSLLFEKYPQLTALQDRELFSSGKLMGTSGVVWNDELDIDVETVYEDGIDVGTALLPLRTRIGHEVLTCRQRAGITQAELAKMTKIDQSDISKIERGAANPSVSTLERIANALGMQAIVKFE